MKADQGCWAEIFPRSVELKHRVLDVGLGIDSSDRPVSLVHSNQWIAVKKHKLMVVRVTRAYFVGGGGEGRKTKPSLRV